MIPRGRTGQVYRTPRRDAHGDPVDENGNVIRLRERGSTLPFTPPVSLGSSSTYVGEVKGILMGGLSASPSLSRQESSDTTGQIGIPNKNLIKVQFGDRIVIDGVKYKVTSRGRWDYPNSMSGTRPEYHWVSVAGTEDG